MRIRLRSRLPYALTVFSLLSIEAPAQNYQQEINDQVWKPFVVTFNQFETEKFMVLHSKDVVRSSRDANQVLNWQQYHDQQKKGDDWSRENGYKRKLELRFTERIASADQAIETGIYKTTSIDGKGEARSGYGKFVVVLRKENGTWKILVDTDSSEGNSIGENHFRDAKPLE